MNMDIKAPILIHLSCCLQDQLPGHLQGGGDDVRRAPQRAGDKPVARGDHTLRPVGKEVRRQPPAIVVWTEPCARLRPVDVCVPGSSWSWPMKHRRCTLLLPWPALAKTGHVETKLRYFNKAHIGCLPEM